MNTRTKNRAFRLSGPFYDLMKERAAVWETSLSDYLRGLVVLETIKNSSPERAFTLLPPDRPSWLFRVPEFRKEYERLQTEKTNAGES